MRLLSLRIKNFKSLADVTFEPSDLTLIVGPNNAGKTNLANAFKFLSEIYEFGLETAVQRAGGYENIAHRKRRRSKAAISFEMRIEIFPKDMDGGFFRRMHPNGDSLEVLHTFSFQANKQNIKSEFNIVEEFLRVDSEYGGALLEISRNKKSIIKIEGKSHWVKFLDNLQEVNDISDRSQMLLTHWTHFSNHLTIVGTIAKHWAIFKLNSNGSRSEGIPTPNPHVEQDGSNLPAFVDYLINKRPESWEKVESAMRAIIPELTGISVGYLHQRTLGLFFTEENFGRPWTAEEVSDGTILTLAMLCSAIDPRTTLVFMEEPENSVHPWIIREIISFLKEVSKEKNVILTTHSHTVIDLMHPKDIWAISRESGQSILVRLSETDEDLISGWENGDFKLSDYLDTGLIPNVVP